MKCIWILSLAIPAVLGQTRTASIAGTVLDSKTQRPIPAALVMAVHTGTPPQARNAKSGGDGAFQIQGLAEGKYSLCVQVPGHGYLDPCQWGGATAMVTLVSGQAVNRVSLQLEAASVLYVQVQDAQKTLKQKTRDGRDPELTVGVWGPAGLYYPARASGVPVVDGNFSSGVAYQMAVPRDTALKLSITSRDLILGDAVGASLPGNASQQAFQHASGDPNPKSFVFTVLGTVH